MVEEITKKWKELGKDSPIIILTHSDKAYCIGIKYKDEKYDTWAPKQYTKSGLEDNDKLTLGKLITDSKFLNFAAKLKPHREGGSGSSGSGSTKFDELGEKIDKLIEVIENMTEMIAVNAGMPKDGDKDDWGDDSKSKKKDDKPSKDEDEDEESDADWDKKDKKDEKKSDSKAAW